MRYSCLIVGFVGVMRLIHFRVSVLSAYMNTGLQLAV